MNGGEPVQKPSQIAKQRIAEKAALARATRLKEEQPCQEQQLADANKKLASILFGKSKMLPPLSNSGNGVPSYAATSNNANKHMFNFDPFVGEHPTMPKESKQPTLHQHLDQHSPTQTQKPVLIHFVTGVCLCQQENGNNITATACHLRNTVLHQTKINSMKGSTPSSFLPTISPPSLIMHEPPIIYPQS